MCYTKVFFSNEVKIHLFNKTIHIIKNQFRNSSNLIFFAFFVTITIFMLFMASSNININLSNNKNSFQNFLNFGFNNENKTQKLVSDFNCSPIFENYKQYEVLIDGIKYPQSVPLYLNFSINFDCLNSNKNIKKILYWNGFFGNRDFTYGFGKQKPFIDRKCPVTTCELTADKNQLNDSDLVIVHMRDRIEKIPLNRPSKQRWVFTLYESPFHSENFHRFNGLFNLTSTYRIDSDFPSFYEGESRFIWKRNFSFDEKYNFIRDKSEFAAAVISNCAGSSGRLEYIKELQKYIHVNIFGKCGKKCPSHFKNKKIGDCKEVIAHEYKFYFAFENSICQDYITEKFFSILNFNIIPVVLGGGTYDYFIPKSGYINAQDYKTPKDLADYLVYLNQNKTEYNSYFRWKKHITLLKNYPEFNTICSMCIKLQLESFYGIKKQYIDNISDYWSKKHCKSHLPLISKIFNFLKNG